MSDTMKQKMYEESAKRCMELNGSMQKILRGGRQDYNGLEEKVKGCACGLVRPKDAPNIGFFCQYQSGYIDCHKRTYIECSFKPIPFLKRVTNFLYEFGGIW